MLPTQVSPSGSHLEHAMFRFVAFGGRFLTQFAEGAAQALQRGEAAAGYHSFNGFNNYSNRAGHRVIMQHTLLVEDAVELATYLHVCGWKA